MTFLELAKTLPNGFHDAELHRIEMDYGRRILRLDLDVWIGDIDDDKSQELYRPARISLDNVAFLVIEPPDTNYPWLGKDPIRIDVGEGKPPQSSSNIPNAPSGTSTTWMYLAGLNSFLLFAAADATLDWSGAAKNRA